jgi:hypothetical protein
MSYVIEGLDPAPFRHLYGLSDEALAAEQVVRVTRTAGPAFPCRVTLEDAEPGETLLLLNHEHLPVASPYRAPCDLRARRGRDASTLSRRDTGATRDSTSVGQRVRSLRRHDDKCRSGRKETNSSR